MVRENRFLKNLLSFDFLGFLFIHEASNLIFLFLKVFFFKSVPNSCGFTK